MEALRLYLKSLTPEDRLQFAERCGTTLGYLRKALSVNAKFDSELVINIERESGGAVRCEDVRPDADWAYLRASAPNESRA